MRVNMNSLRLMLLIFTLLVCLEAVASMVTAMRFCSPGQVVSGHCFRCYCNSRRELTNCVSTCSRTSKIPSPGMKLQCVPGRIVRKPCNICVCDSRGKITNCRNTCPPVTTHAPVVVVRQLDDKEKKEASTLAPCFVPEVEVSCENWYPGVKDDEGNTVPPPLNCSSSTSVLSSNSLDGYSSTSDIISTSELSPASTENQQSLSVESSTGSVVSPSTDESIAPNSISTSSTQDVLKESEEPNISVGSSVTDNDPHSNVGVDFTKSTASVMDVLQSSAVPGKKTTEVTNAEIIKGQVPLPNDKGNTEQPEAAIESENSSNMSVSEFTSLSSAESSSEKGVNEQPSPSSGAESSSEKAVNEQPSPSSGAESSSEKGVNEQPSPSSGAETSSEKGVNEQPSPSSGAESSSEKGVNEQPSPSSGAESSSDRSVTKETQTFDGMGKNVGEGLSVPSGVEISSDKSVSEQASVVNGVDSSSDESVNEQPSGPNGVESSSDKGVSEQPLVPNGEELSSVKSVSEQAATTSGLDSSSDEIISKQPSVPSEEGSSSDESVSENPSVSNDVEISSGKSDSEQLSARNGAEGASVKSVSVPPSEPSGDESSSVMITSENAPARNAGEYDGLSMFRRNGLESNGDEETSDAISAVMRRQEEIDDEHFSLNSSSSEQIELVTEKHIDTKEEVIQGTSNYIDLEDETSTDVESRILPFDRNVDSNILAYKDMNTTNTARMEKNLKTPKAGIIGLLFISYMATNIIGWDTFLGAITVDSNSTKAS